MTDRDACTLELLDRFDKLPYENKIVFISQKYSHLTSSVYMNKYAGEAK